MAKQQYRYVCEDEKCGNISNIELGICPKCKSSLLVKEEITNNSVVSKVVSNSSKKNQEQLKKEYIKRGSKQKLSDIKDNEKEDRFKTSYEELNKVFGGENGNTGITKNSLTLISGMPGIGKSTLLLTIQDDMASLGLKTAYISAEESSLQIKKRARRLKVKNDIVVENEHNLLQILTDYEDYDFLIIDSIQMMMIEGAGDPGGIAQVKACVMALMHYSKTLNKTIIIVGQVTKDDKIAGPRVLEHMVDTVIEFDFYDDQKLYRYTRTIKNRFGQDGLIGIFSMGSTGLIEITNPSLLFINNREKKIGASISMIFESNKPIFVETQALIASTSAEKTITQSIGYDLKRIYQILAIIQIHLKESTYQKNIFIATTGRLKIKETHSDLSIAAALMSSIKEKPINDYVFLGEIGLTGEIIKAPNEEELIKQSKKYGFDKVICNTNNYTNISDIIKLFD